MSAGSSSRQRFDPKQSEICISGIGSQVDQNDLLNHFKKYGTIMRYNFTSLTGGFVFIAYEDSSMVDECMRNRTHYLNGRPLYVKRALPIDNEHPRERFETTPKLMIVTDCKSQAFLNAVEAYFSYYGKIQDCRYCQELNFNYILVQFADIDHVDRIILDKPHSYNGHQLDVMKFIQSNIDLMNEKYRRREQQTTTAKSTSDYNHDFGRASKQIDKKEPINEMDLEKEVFRLQNYFKKMNEDFDLQRRQLEDNCSKQLKLFNENADKTRRLQQDLEKEYAALPSQYESAKRENDALNEQYLSVELENFEITSYYEQVLAEEKAKTAQLEAEYNQKLKSLSNNSSSSSPKSQSQSMLHNELKPS